MVRLLFVEVPSGQGTNGLSLSDFLGSAGLVLAIVGLAWQIATQYFDKPKMVVKHRVMLAVGPGQAQKTQLHVHIENFGPRTAYIKNVGVAASNVRPPKLRRRRLPAARAWLRARVPRLAAKDAAFIYGLVKTVAEELNTGRTSATLVTGDRATFVIDDSPVIFDNAKAKGCGYLWVTFDVPGHALTHAVELP